MDYVTWGKTDFKMACRDTDCYPVFLMNFIIDVHKFNIVFGVVSNIWFGVDNKQHYTGIKIPIWP